MFMISTFEAYLLSLTAVLAMSILLAFVTPERVGYENLYLDSQVANSDVIWQISLVEREDKRVCLSQLTILLVHKALNLCDVLLC